MAVFEVQHLIEHSADVEAQTATVGRRHRFGVFAAKYPPPRREGEFELIAVEILLFAAENGRHCRQFQVADAFQLVHDLLLLGIELHLIGENLPFAAAAFAVVLANRLQPVGRRSHQSLYISLHKALARLAHLHVHHVARHRKRHEQHLAVDVGKTVALRRYGFDKDVFKQWFLSAASHINNCIYRPRGALNAL